MAIKKMCAMAVIGAMLMGCLGAFPIWADEEPSMLQEDAEAVLMAGLSQEMPDSYIIKEFGTEDACSSEGASGLTSNIENSRLYHRNARMNWGTNAQTSMFYKTSEAAKKIPTGDYSYINAWIYNPEVKYDAAGAVSQLTWQIKTGNSPTDVGGNHYYREKLTMDWVGWKLISVPLSKFIAANDPNYSYGAYIIAMAANEWVGDTKKWSQDDNYIDIDVMWLSKEAPPTELSVEHASVENGAGYVSADLDGTAAFTLIFNQPLRSDVAQDAITVTQDGEPVNGGYSIEAAEKELRVRFDEKLTAGSTYEIALGTNVFDIYGNNLRTEYETMFTVEAPSTLFKVTGTGIGAGAVDVPVDLDGNHTYSLSFNTPVESAGILQKVTILQDGLKLYDGYRIKAEGTLVQIVMEQNLSPGALYTIRLEEGFLDQFGNALVGDREFSFTTAWKAAETWKLISFGSDDEYKPVAAGVYLTNENTRMFDQTLRIDIPLSPADRTARGTTAPVDATPYNYVNYWMYSPKATPYKLNVCIYTSDSGNSYFLTTIPVNWVGWKLISVPRSSYSSTNKAKWENVNGFSVNANGWLSSTSGSWQEEGYILLDQIYLSREEPNDFAYVGSSFPEGYQEMPVLDGELELTYTNEVAAVREEAVRLKRDGEDAGVPLEKEIEGNRVKIRITGELEYSTSYTVEVTDGVYDSSGQQVSESVSCSFVTQEKGISAGKPVFLDEKGNVLTELPAADSSLTAVCEVKNRSLREQTAVLAVGQYDSAGTMVDWQTVIGTMAADTGETLTAALERKAETVAVRAFVLNREGELLRQCYSLLGAEAAGTRRVYGAEATAGSGLTLDSIELTIDELSLEGISKGWEPVLVELKDEQGTAVLTVPVYPNSEGIYGYSYTFGRELASGLYTVRVTAAGTKAVEKQVKYYDAEERAAQLALVNSAETAKEIKEQLNAGASVFGLEGLGESKIEGIAQALMEQRPYKAYSQFLSMVSNIKTTLEKLNDTGWSGLAAFLKGSHQLVLGDSAAYSDYAALSAKNQNLINQALVTEMPVDSFEAFRIIFDKAVEDYQTGKLNGGGQGGSTGGGSGGSRPSAGTAGGAAGGGTTVGFDHETVSQYANGGTGDEGDIFTDLGTSAWAAESIMRLYEQDVISPAEDKRFRPEDQVTREEFVKLLTAAFGLSPSREGSGFADAEAEAWYEPYLAAAKAAGIVEGKPDGSFGVGQPITRQDMSAMAYRAVNSLGKSLKQPREAEGFVDEAEIDSYAREAVTAMQRAGVLNGMGDGNFRPLEETSRAQAAKVIAGLLDAVE